MLLIKTSYQKKKLIQQFRREISENLLFQKRCFRRHRQLVLKNKITVSLSIRIVQSAVCAVHINRKFNQKATFKVLVHFAAQKITKLNKLKMFDFRCHVMLGKT